MLQYCPVLPVLCAPKLTRDELLYLGVCQDGARFCAAVWRPHAVLDCTVLCCAVLYCTVYCTVLNCTVVSYCIVRCFAVLRGTVLYCVGTVLYCAVDWDGTLSCWASTHYRTTALVQAARAHANESKPHCCGAAWPAPWRALGGALFARDSSSRRHEGFSEP